DLDEVDQPATGEASQDVGADSPLGQLAGRDGIAVVRGEQLERRALAGAEPLGASERLPSGRGEANPAVAGRPGASGLAPGSGRNDERQAARRRRAVLAADPEAEADELRRRTGLQRGDRLDEPLGWQLAALGDLDDDA